MLGSFQAVFIDRDGTIGGGDNVVYPGDFELFPYALDAIKQLKRSNIKVFSFTNQPGIGKRGATKEDFEIELTRLGFDKVYICPHQHGEGCHCRKPSAGMLLKAARENHLDLSRCVVIGDRWTDLLAADEAGCSKILVKTGAGKDEWNKYINNEFFGHWAEVTPDYIASDLGDAVNWLLFFDKGKYK
ncbi:HAD-IIIA family hydrolase [Heyndrickxia sp. NPDC080065]|uniref:HAD-IIIA family hydrolase n=1 Tax=Heyndrickxia sp. NPDC080065 TaxID=3390568 RepID=UPI003D07AFCD